MTKSVFMLTRWASAANGKKLFGGWGENGDGGTAKTSSRSSKTTTCVWPSGYHWLIDALKTAGHVTGACTNFESRQTTRSVPPAKIPPLRKREPNVVARGSRLSAAFQAV